jgi:hypothetical protein
MDATYLNEAIDYDPVTGEMTWALRPRHHFRTDKGFRLWKARFAGTKPGSLDAKGYTRIPINGVTFRAHRLAWLLVYGEDAVGEIDHINGDRSDNRIANLRTVKAGHNARNMKLYTTNTSGHSGVAWRADLGRWAASIGVGAQKKQALGFFDTKEEAVAARRGAEVVLEYHENHGRR